MRTHASIVLASAIVAGALLATTPALALTVTPPGAAPGESALLHIYAPGAQWGPGASVELGSAVTAQSVTVIRPDLLLVRASVDPGAGLGPRDIVVRHGETVVIGADAFTVVGSLGNGEGTQVPLAVNAIVNPGFETGTMSGWIPATWSVATVIPHTGVYDAYDRGGSGGGGLCLRQNFAPPIDSDDVTAFTFWLRQIDDLGIAQVILFHQNTGVSVGVAFPNQNDTWTFEDFTSLRRPNDLITGCHVCGFGGGTPTPDDSWVDDFVLEVGGATAVEPATWGGIKATWR